MTTLVRPKVDVGKWYSTIYLSVSQNAWHAFNRINFLKFLSESIPLRPARINDPNEKSLSTGADDGMVVLYFRNTRLIDGYCWNQKTFQF